MATERPASSAALETSMARVVFPVPTSPMNRRPRPGVELVGDVVGEAADGAHDDGVHVDDRRAIERHAR